MLPCSGHAWLVVQASPAPPVLHRSQGAKALDDLTKRIAVPLRDLVQAGTLLPAS